MATTISDMALDTTTEGGVLKFRLTGDNDKIIEFPRKFIEFSVSMKNLIEDVQVEADDILDIPPIIGADFMNFFLKYCAWMHDNQEEVKKRYKTSEDENGETIYTLDKEAELSEWEKAFFFEMNRFKDFQITDWHKEHFQQEGSKITKEVLSLKEFDKQGKQKRLHYETRMIDNDEERVKFNMIGSEILEKTDDHVTLQFKEYIDDPCQTIWTPIMYCLDYFNNEFMRQAILKFFAQEILPRWTADELKALSKEEFEAMNFKARYSEYDSNRDKLEYSKIDELDPHALPKRTAKELANLMGRNWIKNPHATEDPVEYLNDPYQIYTLVCPGPEKCYAKECPSYQGATSSSSSATKNDDNDN